MCVSARCLKPLWLPLLCVNINAIFEKVEYAIIYYSGLTLWSVLAYSVPSWSPLVIQSCIFELSESSYGNIASFNLQLNKCIFFEMSLCSLSVFNQQYGKWCK